TMLPPAPDTPSVLLASPALPPTLALVLPPIPLELVVAPPPTPLVPPWPPCALAVVLVAPLAPLAPHCTPSHASNSVPQPSFRPATARKTGTPTWVVIDRIGARTYSPGASMVSSGSAT